MYERYVSVKDESEPVLQHDSSKGQGGGGEPLCPASPLHQTEKQPLCALKAAQQYAQCKNTTFVTSYMEQPHTCNKEEEELEGEGTPATMATLEAGAGAAPAGNNERESSVMRLPNMAGTG